MSIDKPRQHQDSASIEELSQGERDVNDEKARREAIEGLKVAIQKGQYRPDLPALTERLFGNPELRKELFED